MLFICGICGPRVVWIDRVRKGYSNNKCLLDTDEWQVLSLWLRGWKAVRQSVLTTAIHFILNILNVRMRHFLSNYTEKNAFFSLFWWNLHERWHRAVCPLCLCICTFSHTHDIWRPLTCFPLVITTVSLPSLPLLLSKCPFVGEKKKKSPLSCANWSRQHDE